METFFYLFALPAGLIVLSVIFLYLGERSRKRRYQKSEASKATSEAVFKKITTCERCGRRNYRITRKEHYTEYEQPPYRMGVDYVTSTTDTTYRITCKDCGHIMYEQKFNDSSQDKVYTSNKSYRETDFSPVTDDEFVRVSYGESIGSCSEWLYFGLGYFFLSLFIFLIIFWLVDLRSLRSS